MHRCRTTVPVPTTPADSEAPTLPAPAGYPSGDAAYDHLARGGSVASLERRLAVGFADAVIELGEEDFLPEDEYVPGPGGDEFGIDLFRLSEPGEAA